MSVLCVFTCMLKVQSEFCAQYHFYSFVLAGKVATDLVHVEYHVVSATIFGSFILPLFLVLFPI